MRHGTCLFCDHAFVAKSKARKFCHDCLPEHSENPAEYMRRYQFLWRVCTGKGSDVRTSSSIAHLHPKKPPKPPSPHYMPPKWHGPKAPTACEQCGTMHWNVKYCSKLCGRRAHNATDGARARHKAASRLRRAQLANVPSIPYRDADIFARDRWFCLLCGLPIDPAVTYPDPMSKSIDHIVPISLGGADAATNVQAAHLVCNMRKHTRFDGFQQMSLLEVA